MGGKVTSIRIDPELLRRAKIVAIEEGITLSDLIQEAIRIVVDWRWLVDELQLNVDRDLLEKMIVIRSRGVEPFIIVSNKTSEEIVKEGRERLL